MATSQRSFRTARGVATVARRRGVGYFGYLLGGVAWPQAAYRFAWGPAAPAAAAGRVRRGRGARGREDRIAPSSSACS